MPASRDAAGPLASPVTETLGANGVGWLMREGGAVWPNEGASAGVAGQIIATKTRLPTMNAPTSAIAGTIDVRRR